MMQRLRASGNIPDKFLRPINSCCWFTSTSLFSASPGSPEGRLKQSKEPLQGLRQTNAPQPPSEQPKKTKIIRPAPRVKSHTKHEMRVKADGWASGGWDSIYSTDSVILLCAYMDIRSSHRLYFMKSVVSTKRSWFMRRRRSVQKEKTPDVCQNRGVAQPINTRGKHPERRSGWPWGRYEYSYAYVHAQHNHAFHHQSLPAWI